MIIGNDCENLLRNSYFLMRVPHCVKFTEMIGRLREGGASAGEGWSISIPLNQSAIDALYYPDGKTGPLGVAIALKEDDTVVGELHGNTGGSAGGIGERLYCMAGLSEDKSTPNYLAHPHYATHFRWRECDSAEECSKVKLWLSQVIWNVW